MGSHGKSGVTFDRLAARQGEGRGWRISAFVINAVDAPHVYLQGPSGSPMASNPASPFDPMEPFGRDELLREVLRGFATFDYKLYGPIPLRLHQVQPMKTVLSLNLGY